jgi:hypothetical protein
MNPNNQLGKDQEKKDHHEKNDQSSTGTKNKSLLKLKYQKSQRK